MTRVAHVITDTNFGGAGRVLLNMLKARDRGAFDVSVIIPRGSVLKPMIEALGCAAAEAGTIAERSFSAASVLELARVLRGLRPDIVATHACMSARVAARLFLPKSKIVFTRHCAFDVPAYKKRFPYKTVSGFINNAFADRVIATSPVAYDSLADAGVNPKKVTVVFNGVDAAKRLGAEERLAVRRRYGISGGDFVCAMVARLEKVKGHRYAIEAFKRLPPGVKLVIAGEGGEEQALRQAASGLANCVFTGFIKDIYEIENIMDAQLNLSDTETTCAAILEGLSLGVPAIVSNLGGNPFVIKDGLNGLLLPDRAPETVSAAILELRASKERYNKMSEDGERIFREKFTSEAMTKAVEREYLRLI